MKLRTFILIIAISIGALSCKKVIRYDGDDSAKKIVLNSFANIDSTLSVSLSHSVSIVGREEVPKDYYNKSAVVSGKVNGGESFLFTYRKDDASEGRYVSNYLPKSGDEVKISASLPGYGNAEATITIPQKADYSVTDFVVSQTTTDGYTEIGYKVKIKIKDAGHTKDYYRLQLISYSKIPDGEYIRASKSFISEDIIFKDVGASYLLGKDVSRCYFNDDLINGKEYEFEVNAYGEWRGEGDAEMYEYGVVVDVQKITLGLYNYLTSLDTHDSSIFGGLISEKVPVYSNINGGIGIFAAIVSNRTILKE